MQKMVGKALFIGGLALFIALDYNPGLGQISAPKKRVGDCAIDETTTGQWVAGWLSAALDGVDVLLLRADGNRALVQFHSVYDQPPLHRTMHAQLEIIRGQSHVQITQVQGDWHVLSSRFRLTVQDGVLFVSETSRIIAAGQGLELQQGFGQMLEREMRKRWTDGWIEALRTLAENTSCEIRML